MAWDLSSAKLVSNRSFTSIVSNARDVYFNSTGTKVFFTGAGVRYIYQADLSTAYDVTTSSNVKSYYISAVYDPWGLYVSSDGLKVFIVDGNSTRRRVYQYSMSSAWDISTCSYTGASPQFTTGSYLKGLSFNSTMSKMYVGEIVKDDVIYEVILSTPGTITSANISGATTKSIGSYNGYAYAMCVGSDGKNIYMTNAYDLVIEQWGMTSYTLSTASHTREISTSSYGNFPSGIFITNDGTKLFMVDGTNKKLVEWSMDEPSRLGLYPTDKTKFIPNSINI